MLAPNAGPFYASDEKIALIRAGVKKADKLVQSKEWQRSSQDTKDFIFKQN